jgi:hypothetical protein
LAAALDSSSAGPQGQGGAGDAGIVTEAEWKAKYEAVKAQLPAYKAMKKELAELEAEVGLGRDLQSFTVAVAEIVPAFK